MRPNCGRFGELSSLRMVDSLRETSLGAWHFESPRDVSRSQERQDFLSKSCMDLFRME